MFARAERRPRAAPARGPASGGAFIGLLMTALLLLPAVGHARDHVDAPTRERAAALDLLLAELRGAPVREQLRAVNRFFNSLAYRSDRELWGREDHWATPAELLRLGAGDCEDLAIAKYFALRRLGIPAGNLRVTYARDLRRGSSHMVLSYGAATGSALLLDSREKRLRAMRQRPELAAIYGFNEHSVTVYVPGGGERSFPHEGRWILKRWQALLRRREPGGRPPGAGPSPDARRGVPVTRGRASTRRGAL